MKNLFLALFSLALLNSCFNEGSPALPGKVGPAGQVLVVCDPAMWSGPIEYVVDSLLTQSYPVLPRVEAQFDIELLDPREYDRFWKPHRNILFIEVADRLDTKDPSLKFYRNRHANGQVYMEAKGKTKEIVAETIKARGNELVSLLNTEEVGRIASLVKAYENESINAQLAERHGFSIHVPREAFIAKETEDFIWVQREITRMKGGNNHDIKQGYFIYSYPYTSDSLFSFDAIISKRNEVLKANVEGEVPGSYMTTQPRITPRYEEVTFKGKFAAEIRGLWRMEGDKMGGPFYSLSFLDEKTNRIITVDGYAYAPYFNKREYIREVEAILKTFEFASGKNPA